MTKVELHVCNSPKDTAYWYYNKYQSINNVEYPSLTICNSRSILSAANKIMIFCKVEYLEYYHGQDFNTIIYHDGSLDMVNDNIFQRMLTRERR